MQKARDFDLDGRVLENRSIMNVWILKQYHESVES